MNGPWFCFTLVASCYGGNLWPLFYCSPAPLSGGHCAPLHWLIRPAVCPPLTNPARLCSCSFPWSVPGLEGHCPGRLSVHIPLSWAPRSHALHPCTCSFCCPPDFGGFTLSLQGLGGTRGEATVAGRKPFPRPAYVPGNSSPLPLPSLPQGASLPEESDACLPVRPFGEL